ncbi:hypothetical protein AZO1586I_1532 [Bathymodiolus thermophilus thioautotrophic gill symbiont]|uniref:Steroid 5-alpha reductase C-terminal domain-containing protein n=1 Tax=Bathymodiolus thermophilus thioautotrophic gill symbiont TaxID=2360 RepID=A0ABN7G7Z2_9GAMM|nr:hypothetical protein AZO1586I_57 [Bathymodiolus thermophilus thioautotrophic gill symbiont]CAB5505912.1 hypothetical protein AZO1586I_1532 [Bathymodiolus thermophilus thioautotrophic gill symbiont]
MFYFLVMLWHRLFINNKKYAPCGELYWENIYYLIPIFL